MPKPKKLAVITPHAKAEQGAIRKKLNGFVEKNFAEDGADIEGYGIVLLKRNKSGTYYAADWSVTHSPYHHAELPEIVKARLQERITKQVLATDG